MVRCNDLQAANAITFLVDSGANKNYLDNKLIPKPESFMLDYTLIDKLKEIIPAGQQLLPGTATGILPGVITDRAGTKHDVGFLSLIVPRLGRNLFSFANAATRGINTVTEAGSSRLELNDFIVPPEQQQKNLGLFSLRAELGAGGIVRNTPTPAMPLSTQAHAYLWCRCISRMNSRSMKLTPEEGRLRNGLHGCPFRLRHLSRQQTPTEGAPEGSPKRGERAHGAG